MEGTMIEQWQRLTEWERQEAIRPAAEALNLSPAEAVALVSRTLTETHREALERASDPDIPTELSTLALITEAVTGQPITAIKRGPATRNITAYPPGFDRLSYHARRLSGELRSDDPIPQYQDYTAWYFITTGNPITIEGYLKSCGYPEAFADRPTACRVREV